MDGWAHSMPGRQRDGEKRIEMRENERCRESDMQRYGGEGERWTHTHQRDANTRVRKDRWTEERENQRDMVQGTPRALWPPPYPPLCCSDAWELPLGPTKFPSLLLPLQ